MKKRNQTCLILSLALLGWIVPTTGFPENSSNENQLILAASKNLSKTAMEFVREYPQKGETIKIKAVDQPVINLSDAISGTDGGFFEESTAVPDKNPLWKLIIGREITVAVINSHNPTIESLKKEGIPIAKFSELVKGESGWSSAVTLQRSDMANVFRIEGVSIPESADTFLGIHSEDQSKALAIPDFMTAIQNNPNAIGLCRLSDVMGPDRRSLIDGIVLLPFDRNNNGQLDYHEQIYGSVENFLRGVWIGKYPNQLVTNIYFVSETQPQDAGVKEFLSWIITEGQPYLMTNGVTELTAGERLSKLEKINQALNLPNNSEVKQAGGKSIIIIAGLFAFVCVLFLLFVYRRNRSGKKYAGTSAHLKTINENVLTMPSGLYFDKSHTWVYLEKDGLAKVGIDDFLLHITGSFSRVKMKESGSKIKKGEAVLTLIQNGKQINLHSPVSGTIREINDVLITNPEVIHESPYDLGWIYMVEPSNWLREIQFFNLASTYRDWVKSEFIRLKDFLAASLNSRSSSVPILSLQEGGELKCHILRDLGPEIWEEFQSNFIDNQNN